MTIAQGEPPAPEFGPAFYRDAIDLSLDIVTLIDAEGRIVFESPAVERVLGYRVEERLGRLAVEFVHSDDRGIAERAIARVAREGELGSIEMRVRHGDGSWRYIESAGRRWRRGGATYLLTTARDVSDRRRALEALERSNELLTKTLRSSRNIVSLTKVATGEFLEVNDEWLRVAGYSRDEVIGHTSIELGVWGDAANRERLMRDLHTSGGRLRDYEICTYPRSGPHQFLINVETLELEGEQMMLMTGTDITHSRLVEEQLRQSQKMEAVGQLTGGVAHDFNNLLGIVMGNAELLGEQLGDAALRELAETILRAAERGATLTRQLLAFSRRQELSPQPVILERIIADMLPLLRSSLPPNVEAVTRVGPAPGVALVDPAQLENAILNLVLNARDAMPDGGRVVISAESRTLEEGAMAEYPQLSAGGYVAVEVSDTGRGMSDETRARAFDPFYTTKAPGRGTGLGLSMVFGFVRQSGGDVRIHSDPGAGTRVTLLLPRAGSTAAGEATAHATLATGSETIVVLEDEPELLSTATSMLTRLGYRVLPAANEEALAAILGSEESFDLLLSDVLLTGSRRGPEIARDVIARRPGMAVLFMSGHPAGDDVGSDAAPAPLLPKPFAQRELADAVRSVLDRRSGAEGTAPDG